LQFKDDIILREEGDTVKEIELMNPKIDFVFKLLFGNEKDTSFLISLQYETTNLVSSE